MKLYTEREITESLESMGLELMVNDFFQMSEPIELPSDKDIENIAEKTLSVNLIGFITGAKWIKEQILNQNKS
jgi:hypothetical protein